MIFPILQQQKLAHHQINGAQKFTPVIHKVSLTLLKIAILYIVQFRLVKIFLMKMIIFLTLAVILLILIANQDIITKTVQLAKLQIVEDLNLTALNLLYPQMKNQEF